MSIDFAKPGWVAAALIGATFVAPPALPAQQDAPVASRRVTHKIVPLYPEMARRWHLEGTVKMSATVAPDGAVKSIKITGGNPVLALAAEQAVKQWKYELAARETTEGVSLVFKDTQ